MLLLLDIDGVMVVGNSWKRPEFLSDGFPEFSNKATIALQKLISETNADILLTTSHKANYSIKMWKEIFNLRGISTNNIYSLPENKTFLTRKEEIMNWFDSGNQSKEFLILDDDKSLNSLSIFIKQKLIQTNSSVGLTLDLVDEGLALIKSKKVVFAQ